MKIGKVSPIFKKGDKSILSNYRPISALPCFSKILERITYNRLYPYLAENNILFVSDILKLIMFADDTNLFCSSNEIKTLFLNTNLELQKISEWFRANKLSLNEDKTTFTLFHRIQDRDNLPSRLPIL